MTRTLALAVVLATGFLAAQPNPTSAQNRSHRRTRHTTHQAASQPADDSASSTGCDAALLKHVYHPARLVTQQKCVTITGTIVDASNGKRADGMRHEPDGDTHGWLKLDSQFKNLINSTNTSKMQGNMVFEVVCKYPVTSKGGAAAVTACKGYHSPIAIPALNSHVAITGPLVHDVQSGHGWMEIHPVTSIVVQ